MRPKKKLVPEAQWPNFPEYTILLQYYIGFYVTSRRGKILFCICVLANQIRVVSEKYDRGFEGSASWMAENGIYTSIVYFYPLTEFYWQTSSTGDCDLTDKPVALEVVILLTNQQHWVVILLTNQYHWRLWS